MRKATVVTIPSVMTIGQTVANTAIFATFIMAAVRHLGLMKFKYFHGLCKRVMSVTMPNIAAISQTFFKI